MFGKSPEDYACEDARKILINFVKKQKCWALSFDEVEAVLLQKSVIYDGLIINGVLNPLIEAKKIEKMNLNGKRNFKKDNYLFRADTL